jgi:hypothetical protein
MIKKPFLTIYVGNNPIRPGQPSTCFFDFLCFTTLKRREENSKDTLLRLYRKLYQQYIFGGKGSKGGPCFSHRPRLALLYLHGPKKMRIKKKKTKYIDRSSVKMTVILGVLYLKLFVIISRLFFYKNVKCKK